MCKKTIEKFRRSTKSLSNWLKENINSLCIWIVVIAVVSLCFINQINTWDNTEYLTVYKAVLIIGVLLAILIASSFVALILYKQQAIEKKILLAFGFIAIGMGILGFSYLVFENRITFFDVLYKTAQLFVGEFDVEFDNKPVPAILNIARFLALIVSSGTIAMLILGEKVRKLKISLFYKDIVIIADKPEGYIIDLATSFIKRNRKVVIGYISDCEISHQRREGDIPLIFVDIHDNKMLGLKVCNVKKAKVIYLLCQHTENNIKLAKKIYSMFHKLEQSSKDYNVYEKIEDNKTVDELVEDYLGTFKENKTEYDTKQKTSKKTVCYIQYIDDEEKYYYSIDRVFNDRTDNFDTFFVNPYDISIRQLLTQSSIINSLNISKEISLEGLKEQLNDIKVVVSGSGQLLDRTIIEIAKNCIYNSNTPMKIHYMKNEEHSSISAKDILPVQLCGLVELEIKSVKELSNMTGTINLLFISSSDEKEIRTILQKIFQYDIQDRIHEYLILTKGNDVEYEILQTYINSLLRPFYDKKNNLTENSVNPTIYLSRVTDLMLTINKFYKSYGPKSEDIHQAYGKAFVDEKIKDFSKLPEVFRESNVLCAFHNEFVMDIIDKIIIKCKESYTNENESGFVEEVKGYLDYLSITEHERWYNERRIQGYIYSKEKSNLYNKNPNLLYWNKLSDEQRLGNLRYFLQTLIHQRKKNKSYVIDEDIYKKLIIEYRFKESKEQQMEESI